MTIYINEEKLNLDLFPNNETKIDGEQVKRIVWNRLNANTITFKYRYDTDLIQLMLVKRFMDDLGAYDTKLVIAYMPYSRMDRREYDSTPFTLKYVSEFINSLSFKEVKVVEPHSDVTCALLNKSRPDYPTFHLVDKVAEMIAFDKTNDYLFFPDGGASKRYGSKMKGYMSLVGNKTRDFNTGSINGLEIIGKKPEMGFIAIIVDDLCSRGGTFMLGAEKLREFGATEVYLLVTHTEETIFHGDILKTDLINKVFTTDTLLSPCGEEKKIHQFNILGVK